MTGRKKELIVTAGGKNVAPAVLEDRLRAHPLVSQCLVVGDGRPYVACLITLDAEAVDVWKARRNRPADTSLADLTDDPDLLAELQAAVDDANKAVSRAESIRRFRVLDTGLHRADRLPDALAQGAPERRHQGLRGRDRGALRLTGGRGRAPRPGPRPRPRISAKPLRDEVPAPFLVHPGHALFAHGPGRRPGR